jgi:hypothetical protein
MEHIETNYLNGNINRACKDFIEQKRNLSECEILSQREKLSFADSIINRLNK